MRRGGSDKERRLSAAFAQQVAPGPPNIILLRGLPWEAGEDEVWSALLAAIPGMVRDHCSIAMICDNMARPSGNAFVRLPDDYESMDVAIIALSGWRVGSRYLEARRSSQTEMDAAIQLSREAQERASKLTSQTFLSITDEKPAEIPHISRDILILCHGVPVAVAQGSFALNDLVSGRVDLMARCLTSALFYSHGVRKHVRVFIHMVDHCRTLCCDGAEVRGLKPDERTIGAAMKRALHSAPLPGSAQAPRTRAEIERGWHLRDGDNLDTLLDSCMSPCGRPTCATAGSEAAGAISSSSSSERMLLMLHEQGEPLETLLASLPAGADASSHGNTADCASMVLVLGDHVGYSDKDVSVLDARGAARACLGPMPLLTSQCIILCHHALDCRAGRRPSGIYRHDHDI